MLQSHVSFPLTVDQQKMEWFLHDPHKKVNQKKGMAIQNNFLHAASGVLAFQMLQIKSHILGQEPQAISLFFSMLKMETTR